jgi:hypothetical protein
VFYRIAGMNDSGVVVGTYAIVNDQPAKRAFESFGPAVSDLDSLFNGRFGYGPTGESIYGVDAQGRAYGNVTAPQTSISDPTPLSSDFVTLGSLSYNLAPSGTYAGLTFDNNRVTGIAPPDISTVDNGTGWTLLDVEAENAAGQIAGLGRFNGGLYVYRLTPLNPVPEPSSLVLFSIGGLAVLGCFRRRQVRQTSSSLR